MKKILLCLLMTPCFSYSTTIIVYKTKTTIFVAADSKTTHPDTKGSQTTCNIQNVGSKYFVAEGLDLSILLVEARQSLKDDQDILYAIYAFGTKMQQHYKPLLEAVKKEDPQTYSSCQQNDISTVSFFGFNNNVPYLMKITFNLSGSSDPIIGFNVVMDSLVFSALGHHDHIDELGKVKFEQMFYDKRGTIYGLENLVKFEITKHEETTDNPIDLLHLTQAKANWIRKKTTCL